MPYFVLSFLRALCVRLPHFLHLCRAFGRLYVKGVMMGFKRGLRNQHEHTSLLKIDKVVAKEDTAYYLGKRVCFIYKAQKEIRGTKFRTIWGRITRPHGSGSVFTLSSVFECSHTSSIALREKQRSHVATSTEFCMLSCTGDCFFMHRERERAIKGEVLGAGGRRLSAGGFLSRLRFHICLMSHFSGNVFGYFYLLAC